MLQSAPQPSGELQKLDEFVTREWPGESHQQTVTSIALTLLADAIEASALRQPEAGTGFAAGIVRLRQQINDYRDGPPGELEQSTKLRRILIDASVLIDRLLKTARARGRPHDPRLNALERSARSFSEEATALRQGDVIERFFRHAVEALRRLEEG